MDAALGGQLKNDVGDIWYAKTGSLCIETGKLFVMHVCIAIVISIETVKISF